MAARAGIDGSTYVADIVRRSFMTPLQDVKTWSQDSPIKIDALGLVTLLGADEVNQSIGTLQRRRFTEYLPLLAAFVISGDRFTKEQAGFVLYNVSGGIVTTELKGWFTRWLSAQKINNATTVFTWKEKTDTSRTASLAPNLVATMIAFVLVAPLLVCDVLMGDWYGVGNTIAIILSILVRVYLVWQLRRSLQDSAKGYHSTRKATRTLFITRSDGRMVTVHTPQSLLTTFTQDSAPKSPVLYKLARRIGWIAFGVHLCVLGMSTLFTQIYTVILLVLGTWALCSDFDSDVRRRCQGKRPDGTVDKITIPFNSDWEVEQHNPLKLQVAEPCKQDRRMIAWARVDMNEKEEQIMRHWSLLPFDTDSQWYDEYKAAKESFRVARKEANGAWDRPALTSASAARPPARPYRSATSASRLLSTSVSNSATSTEGSATPVTPGGRSLNSPDLDVPPATPAKYS